MQDKPIGRRALVILALAIVAVGYFWPDSSTREILSSAPADRPEQHTIPAASVEADPSVSTAPVARGAAAGGVDLPNAPAPPRGAMMQIDVRAPTAVNAGETFEATVNLDTSGGIRHLAFAVTFNKFVLQLVGSSAGTFVQQAGAPVQFGAEETSDGNVQVTLDVNDGAAIAGMGSVVVLQLQAKRAGTSDVTVQSVFVDDSQVDASTTTPVQPAVVIVN